MRTKVKIVSPELRLTRILLALEQELVDASDEDIMEAARDLGMNPKMKGSAAFLGIRFSAKMQLAGFFEDTPQFKQLKKAPAKRWSRDH